MNNSSIPEICAQLERAQNIAVFCHNHPDGDAIGAATALATALNGTGKFAVACCEDKICEKYDFLKGTNKLVTELPVNVKFDTYISVDCADVTRLGVFAVPFLAFKGTTINIDHHVSNKRFAQLNCVSVCSATCEILTRIIVALGVEINVEIANLLMLGLIADSGNFTHSDVTDITFETAAMLKKHGADQTNINYQIFLKQTKFRARLFAKAITDMRFALDDKLAFIIIEGCYGKTVFDSSISEGFVDFPLTIDGIEVAVSMLEVKKRAYKISFRSKGKVDVNAVAGIFGGGGHVLASGCMLSGELEEVVEKITYAVYQNL